MNELISPSLAPALVQGLVLSFGLIVAIGAQNAFVLRQGLRREHVGGVVVFCALADAVLIAAGVFGMAQALAGRFGLLHRTVVRTVAAMQPDDRKSLSGLMGRDRDFLQCQRMGCRTLLSNGTLCYIVKASQHGSVNDGSHGDSDGDGGETDGIGSCHFDLQLQATAAG